MSSKTTLRNLIVSVVLLLIGFKALLYLGEGYISAAGGNLPFVSDYIAMIKGMDTMMTYGLAAILAILIVAYLLSGNKEKRQNF